MINNQKTEIVECTATADDDSIVADQPRRPVLRKIRRTLSRTAMLLAIIIAIWVAGIFMMNVVPIGQLHQMQRGLAQFGEWWMVVRLAFIAGLIIGWVPINTWLARRNDWSPAHLARVLAGRWMTLGILAFVELFLVQRLHEPFTDRWFQ